MSENMRETDTIFDNIDLYSILRDLVRSFWAVILGALAVAMVTYMFVQIRFQNSYTTSATFVVTSRTSSNHTYSNLSAASTMAESFSNILNSNLLKKKVMEDLGTSSFNATASASIVSETNLMTLRVKSDTPENTYKTIKSIMKVVSELTQYVSTDMVMDVLQEPPVPTHADLTSPAKKRAIQALLISAAAFSLIFMFFSYRKETVRSETELETVLNAKSLGAIRYANTKGWFRSLFGEKNPAKIRSQEAKARSKEEKARLKEEKKAVWDSGKGTQSSKKAETQKTDTKKTDTQKADTKNASAAARKRESRLLITEPGARFDFIESFRKVGTRISAKAAESKARVIMVTSTIEHEGKSVISANLALTLANRDKKVLLIDGDFRRPTLFRLFNQYDDENNTDRSLGAVLAGDISLDEALVRDNDSKLWLLLNHYGFSNSTDMVSSQAMHDIIRILKHEFDYVIIDTPPVQMMADAEAIAGEADMSVLVVKYDTVGAPEINDVIDTLRDCKAEFAGCVLSQVHMLPFQGRAVVGYGAYGSYGRYGRYGKYGKYGSYGSYGSYGGYGSYSGYGGYSSGSEGES